MSGSGGVRAGVRPMTLSPLEYLCSRCGIRGKSRPERLHDELGRRRPTFCRDCWPIARREGLVQVAS